MQSFDVPLDDSGLQTYIEEEFPYPYTQSPFRTWSEIFQPTLVDHIVEQTNLYAHCDCNFPAFSTGREDVSSFLGVLLSGYHHLPEEDHYWPNCEDLGVPIVSKAMTQTIDSWEEMALATFYERVERDCRGGMADPLQDRRVSDVTSRLPTGDCNLCAEHVHGQPFASWRWTVGQPA